MTIRDVAGVQSRHIPVKLVQHLMHKQVRRSVDVFVNETCQKSQKFVQLFSAFYSLIVITVNTDNFKESNLQIVHEYLSKLQHFSGKFEKLPIYFVLFTASPEDGNMLGSNQHKGKVHDVQTKLRLLLKTVGKQNYVEFFTINLGSNLCSGMLLTHKEIEECITRIFFDNVNGKTINEKPFFPAEINWLLFVFEQQFEIRFFHLKRRHEMRNILRCNFN